MQEANCPGVPEDVEQYLRDYYWDRFDNTIYNADTWESVDTKIASTAAIDKYIDSRLTSDITGEDGIRVTTSPTEGTVQVGINAQAIDFVELASGDIINETKSKSDTNTTPSNTLADNKLITAATGEHRYRNYYEQNQPAASTNPVKGQIWVRPGQDPQDPDSTIQTLHMWDGNSWEVVSSGGGFTNQPTIIYVDKENGQPTNDGRRIIQPVDTIQRALHLANDGDLISVAPGVYREVLPLDIKQKNLSIVGTSIRSVFVQPQATYEYEMTDNLEYTDYIKNPNFDPNQAESATNSRWISESNVTNPNYNQSVESVMFRLNSGSYISNMTCVGMKAHQDGSNPRASDAYAEDGNPTGLPSKQGWIFGLMPGAYFAKSPYVQNCTNFSDSGIDNTVDFNPSDRGFDPTTNPPTVSPGFAGDESSAFTGGGIIIDGAVPHVDSPLRSIVADSFTQVGLKGPGIYVTNNGYAQLTSSYAFFTHFHLKAFNGGQANLAASTTDFGDYGLVAIGKSPNTIFTSTAGAQVSDNNPALAYGEEGAHNITITQPTITTGWFGSATRPQPNMLIEIGSNIYPIISSTANGNGWDVKISNPDSANKSQNNGLIAAVTPGTAINFYLRSMIASSGHTMEYVGSGTDYRALPENGGVPNEGRQITEDDDNEGKVWAVTVDHKGKLKAGSDFAVDQETGAVLLGTGALAIPTLITNLDTNGKVISDTAGDIQIGASTNVDMNTNKIVELGAPTNDADAATKLYTDGKVEAVAVTAPITQSTATANGVKTVSLDVSAASTSAAGVVQLYDNIDSTSTTNAATANAVKTAYDHADTANTTADAALPTTGGAMSGNIDLNQNVTITFDDGSAAGSAGSITGITDDTATTSSTVVASATAVKAAYDHADAALPLSGGTMTGAIDLDSNAINNGGAISAASVTTTGNIVIGGNLQVDGTTTTVNSTEITIDDTNITLGSIVGEDFVGNTVNNNFIITGLSNDDFAKVIDNMLVTGTGVPANTYIVSHQTVNNVNQVTLSNNISGTQQNVTFSQPGPSTTYADGGGITLKATTDKTFNYDLSNFSWTSSENINVASGKDYQINGTSVLNGTTLGAGVTGSSLTGVGTITSGTWNGTAIGAGYGGTGISTTPAATQLLVGNSNNGYELRTLAAGTNTAVDTATAGQIKINATDTTYTAGNGLDLSNGAFSADLKANGGLVTEGQDNELAVDLSATDITGTLGVGDGGTGQTTYADGELLIGNTDGSTLTKATLTASTNVNITNGNGTISISATDTTYTAGDGLDLTSGAFSVDLATANPGLEIDANGQLEVDSSVARTAGATFTGDVFLSEDSNNDRAILKFKELASQGENFVGFKAPSTISQDVTWILPDEDGNANQVIVTNGGGALSWADQNAARGGGTNQVFFENDQVVSMSYTITSNKNAMSAGPITINQGITVTVPQGSAWTVV